MKLKEVNKRRVVYLNYKYGHYRPQQGLLLLNIFFISHAREVYY